MEIASGDEGCLPNPLSQNVNTMTQLLLLSLTHLCQVRCRRSRAKRLPLHRSGLAPRPHPPRDSKGGGGEGAWERGYHGSIRLLTEEFHTSG